MKKSKYLVDEINNHCYPAQISIREIYEVEKLSIRINNLSNNT